MELVEGVSLLAYLKSKSNRKADEAHCPQIFYQIVKGIEYCHNMSICHRDVKLENIIIDDKLSVKIIDFGFAAMTTKTKLLNFFCGTPSYMPPEIVQKRDYIGFYADIWSLGILFYTLLCGCFPFRATNEKDLYSKIIKGEFPFPNYLSFDSMDLLKNILNVNPSNRPSCDDVNIIYNNKICKHLYFSCVNNYYKSKCDNIKIDNEDFLEQN